MVLDEPNDNDEVFDDNGLSYIIDKELLEKAKPIRVDYVNSAFGSGFAINSSLQMAAACGSCTSC